MSIRIAVVEDDDDYRDVLSRALRARGMEVIAFGDAESFADAIKRDVPDVVVLDVNLPGESGFIAAARLRAMSTVGIIMLTGRTPQEDKITGLSVGADYYLLKPVDLRELEAVIRNLVRRLHATTDIQAPDVQQPADGPVWVYYREKWLLKTPGGNEITLSAAENQLLQPLLEHPGVPESRGELNTRLGRPKVSLDNRSLDVLVSRLRRKVERLSGETFPLKAARGSGYVFIGNVKVV